MTRAHTPLYIMAALSAFIALGSYRFLGLGLPLAFPDMLGHIEFRRLAFLLHVSAAPVALVLASMQIMPGLRAKRPTLHRWTGRAYGIGVLVAASTGLVVASGAAGGISAQLGFATLSVLWLVATALGVMHARARRFRQHRRWMLRSFAMTFTGVTLRLYLLGFFGAGFNYTEASVYLAWLGWVPNLIFIEWWLRRRPNPGISEMPQPSQNETPSQRTA